VRSVGVAHRATATERTCRAFAMTNAGQTRHGVVAAVPPAIFNSAAGTAAATSNLSGAPEIAPYQLFQFFVHFGEGINREFQVFARMRGGDLRADAGGAMWNDRIKEADHVNAFLQHARGELL